jgi:hypothetical protein
MIALHITNDQIRLIGQHPFISIAVLISLIVLAWMAKR